MNKTIVMVEVVKICPECGAEFFPHVETCNVCDIGLVYPEEMEGRTGEKREVPEFQDGPPVLIDEGGLPRVKELSEALEERGMKCLIIKAECTGSACQGRGEFGLFVPQSIAEAAKKVIEDHWHRLHPEIEESKKRLEEGRCPACGFALSGSSTECPDCGLYLGE